VNICILKKRFPQWRWEHRREFGSSCYFGALGDESVRIEAYTHRNGVWIVYTRRGQFMLGQWDGEP